MAKRNEHRYVALYERLSHDDEQQGESNSIVNQKRILEDYALSHGMTVFRHFTDDGISGTRFDRPGFQNMIDEVRAGNIEACIIKDMSRLGIYSQIKEQVSTREVAEHYGIKVNRAGMACCPFHPDKTPSMKVDKNFVCFGCQEKGDVIRFASKLFGLSPYDAAGKLIEDMGLTVTAENRPEVQPGIRQKAKRERTEKQQFEQAVNRVYNVFCDYFHLLNRWAEEYAPRSPTEDLHPLFVEAMHKRDYVEYLLDLLLYGSREDKAFVLIDKGKEVDDLERRIREAKSGGRECTSLCNSSLTAGHDDRGRDGSSGNDGERSGKEPDHKRRNDPVL